MNKSHSFGASLGHSSASDSLQLFSFWKQGYENAPVIVKRCIHRARDLHDSERLSLFDDSTIPEWFDAPDILGERWELLCLAHQSDLLRTALLLKFGGVWADPTVWFNTSIEGWLPRTLENCGLFMFHRPGRDRVISNWFIAAEPENLVLKKLYARLLDYWGNNEFHNLGGNPPSKLAKNAFRVLNRNLLFPRLWTKPIVARVFHTAPYMIYHYMFYDLVRSDKEARRIWDNMLKVSAVPAIRPQRFGLLSPLTEAAKKEIDSPEAPLFKLTWKLPSQTIPRGSVLDYLLNRGSEGAQVNHGGMQ